MSSNFEMPRKTRDMHNHHVDSTIWDSFKFRPDDIVVGSWAKSGTTLLQQMVGQLIFNGDGEVDIASMSPWLDLRIGPREERLQALEAQTHRRFVKTHLPVDALTMSAKAKYIFIGRDGRDAVWSLHNHHAKANEGWYKALNETPGLVGPPISRANPDTVQYFREWLDGDGYPFWSFWDVIKSWWDIRHLPNVLLVHYADAIRDKDVIRQVAAFLEIEVDDKKWDDMLEHCSMDYMRKHGDKIVPGGGSFWNGGVNSFLFKGVNGRWKGELTTEDCEKYEKTSKEKLGEDCAKWLANGGAIA